MRQLVKAKYIIINSHRVIDNGAILVDNGKIVEIYDNEVNIEDVEVLDFNNSVIMAGFINLHCHLQFTLLDKSKLSNIKTFSGWIIELIKQYNLLLEHQKTASFKEGLKQSLLSGCTCICNLGKETEFIEILEKSGLSAFYFLEMFSNDVKSSEQVFKDFLDVYFKLKEKNLNNVKIGVSPHSIYNTHIELWRLLTDFSNENNILLQSHLAESIDEEKWVIGKPSEIDKIHEFVGWKKSTPILKADSSVDYLIKQNFSRNFNENIIFAHLNQAHDNELVELNNHHVNIAHCPRSNNILHGKTLNLKQLFDKSLFTYRVGLGTDSLFSNHDLSIFNEAKYAKTLYNFDFWQTYKLLTENPSKILKQENKMGSLDIGKQADFVIFKLEDNENYIQIFEKKSPDHVFLKGRKVVDSGVLSIDI